MNASVSQFQAVGLALAGYTLWVLADTSLKIVGASTLPAYEVIALIGIAEVVLLILHGLGRNRLAALWPKNPRRQLLRSFLDLGNNFCVVVALRHLPLALFYILVFLAPTVTTLLAALFLDERLEWKKGLAILAGFLGVAVAVNPFGSARPGDGIGYLACLICVACFSTNMVYSRVMTQTEAPESLTLFSALLMAVAGSAAMLHSAEPLTLRLAMVLLATGFFCVLGNFCFFVALKHTSAATVSQYHYSQLLTGTLIAYLIWHERPTVAMYCGAALIVGSGCYTAIVAFSSSHDMASLAPTIPKET